MEMFLITNLFFKARNKVYTNIKRAILSDIKSPREGGKSCGSLNENIKKIIIKELIFVWFDMPLIFKIKIYFY